MDDFYAPYTPAGVKPTTAGGSASPPPTGDFYAPYTPAGIQPEDTPDQYAGRAEAAGVKIGRTPEENQDYLRRSGQYSTDQLKEFDKRYRLAVAKEKYRGTTPGGFIEAAGRMTLPLGDFLGVRGENNYGKAKDRVNSGQAKPEDYDTVARYERLQQHDQEVGSTFAGALLQGVAGIPKMVGEAWGAGKVLGAVGGVVGGKVGGFIAGTGGAGAEIESYSLANPAFRNAVTTHAGRMALLTPLMPSMYLEEARQANLDAGRSADDPTGFPAAMLHGYSNMLVLGTMQKQFGGGNLLQRSLAKGAIGVGEQAVADVAGTAWNQIAPDILKINTQGGVLGDLARGEFGDAASHAAVQMLTFSAFAGLHDQGSMAEQKQRIKDAAEAQVKKFNDLVAAAKAEAEAKDKAAAEKAHAEGVESYKEAANFKGYKGTIEQHAVEKASEEIGQQIEEKTAEQIHEDNVRLASNKAYSDTYKATKGDRFAAEKAAADAVERVNAAKEGREPTVAPEQQLTPDQVGQKAYADAIRAGKHPAEANRLAMEAQGKAMPAAPVPEPAPEQKLTPEQVGQKTYADAIRSGLNPAAANRLAMEAQGKAMQEEAAARPGLGETNTPVNATPESPTNAPVETKAPVGDSSPTPENAQPGASQEAVSGGKPAESQAAAPVPAESGTQTPVAQTPAGMSPARAMALDVHSVLRNPKIASLGRAEKMAAIAAASGGQYTVEQLRSVWEHIPQAAFEHAIENSNLTPAQKKEFKTSVNKILDSLPHEVRMMLADSGFQPMCHTNARSMYDAQSPRNKTRMDPSDEGGLYIHTTRELHIDGTKGLWELRGNLTDLVRQLIAHETAHAVDTSLGGHLALSDLPGWKTASVETKPNAKGEYPLTEYAHNHPIQHKEIYGGDNYSESFAEFFRLVHGTDTPTAEINRDFQLMSKFFKTHGLWPEERGVERAPSKRASLDEMFGEAKPIDGGHVDVIVKPGARSGTGLERTPEEAIATVDKLLDRYGVNDKQRRVLLARTGATQEAIASRMGVTKQAISKMEAKALSLLPEKARENIKKLFRSDETSALESAAEKERERSALTDTASAEGKAAGKLIGRDDVRRGRIGAVAGETEEDAKARGAGASFQERRDAKENKLNKLVAKLEKAKTPEDRAKILDELKQIGDKINFSRHQREGKETDTVDSLLRAIQDHPNEQHLRLVIADAIQESGDEARAERIRKDINNPPGERGVSSRGQLDPEFIYEVEQRPEFRKWLLKNLKANTGRSMGQAVDAYLTEKGERLEFTLPTNPEEAFPEGHAQPLTKFGPKLYSGHMSPGVLRMLLGSGYIPSLRTVPSHAAEIHVEYSTEHSGILRGELIREPRETWRSNYNRGDAFVDIADNHTVRDITNAVRDSILSVRISKLANSHIEFNPDQARVNEQLRDLAENKGWRRVELPDGDVRYDSPLRQQLREEQALGYRTGEPMFTRMPSKKDLKGVLDRALGGKEKEDGGGIKGWLIRNFTGPGHLGKKAFEAKLDSDNIVKAYASDVSQGFDDLTKVVGGDWRKVPKAEMDRMNEAMTNEAVRNSLPGPVRDVLERFRSQIDALSNKLIELGVISEKLAAVFKSNLGVYMTRQYRAFTDPNWYSILKSTDEGMATINRFKAWYADEARKMGRGIMTDEQLNGVVDAYLKNDTKHDNPISFITHSKLGSKDIGLLTARKEYPEPLRALWGEIKDPVANYATSIGRMANLMANHIFLHRVKDIGLAEGWLHAAPKEGFSELISGKGSHGDLLARLQPSEQNKDEMTLGMGPLANMYTSKPIREAFEQFYNKEQLPNYLKAYMKILSLTKYAKTVLSPTAHLRQTLGNVFFNIANGHGVSKEANKMLGEMWRGTDDGKRYRRELIERGILDQSVQGNEFKDILRDASEAHDPFTMSAKIVENGMARWLKKGMSWATKSYHWEDAFVKVHAFENEKVRYAEANPTWSKEQVSQKAAEIVSKTFPTYSRVPYAIKWLRRFPLMGPFVSFTSEIVRSTFNTAKLAREEMQDPATRAIGAKRMAGLAVSMSAFAALGAVSRMIAGVSLDEEDSIRHFLPEWNKDSQLLHLGKDENGKYRVIDLGRTDPHSYLMEPFQAGLSGARTGTWSLFNNMEPALKPFIGEEIGTRAMFDIARNKMEQGGGMGEGKVYNPESSLAAKVGAIGSHLLKGVEPGLVDEVFRTGGAALGVPPNENGKPRSVGEELLADFTGQRVAGADPKEALHFAGKTYQERMKNADQELNASVARAKQQGMRLKPEDVGEQYSRGETMRRAVFDDLMNDVNAARMMGLSDGQIVRELKSGGVSQDVIGHLLGGKYVPRNVAEVVNRR